MKPNIECRRLAELLREKAMTMSDPELKAEYAYLVRGFLGLATQLEQDMAERKVPRKPSVIKTQMSASGPKGTIHRIHD
jgi:hypothetical protein